VVLKSFLKLIGSGLVTIILVSSAKRKVLDFTIYKYVIFNLNKSLIQSKKAIVQALNLVGEHVLQHPNWKTCYSQHFYHI
jgi:hypothetical protein